MARTMTRRDFLKTSTQMGTAASLGCCCLLIKGCSPKQEFDLVIKGGRIYDGLGSGPIVADIGIKADSIIQVGKIPSLKGVSVIDARNLAVSPGFIDAHDHSDVDLLVNPKAESHIRQGITTLVSGNCGSSPFPIAHDEFEEEMARLKEVYDIELTWRDIKGFLARLEQSGMALNYATLVGQGSIRGAAMGFNDRPPKPDEIEKMKFYVEDSIKNGAMGLSSGLEYAPGSFAQPDEMAALCQVAAQNGGIYATHMRDEGDYLIEALEETLEVARRSGVRLQISHFKVAYPRNWHKVDEALAKVEAAQKEGISIFCDRYPYIAGATGFSSFNFPLWAKQGTTSEFLARLKDPTLETKFRSHLAEREEKIGSWENVVISSVGSEKNSGFEGKSVQQCVEETGKDVFVFMRDLLIEEEDRVGQIIFMGREENLKKILAHHLVGVGCDGSTMAPYGLLAKGKPHPRNYGTFPRVLGKYIREEKILPLSEMVKKMTSVPAKNFGFSRRGALKSGYFADIVIFDEERVMDKATFEDPHQYPEGIEYVIVNGQVVVREAEHTGSLPGRVLRSRAAV